MNAHAHDMIEDTAIPSEDIPGFTPAKLPADLPAELIAGPCALPDRPMPMPRQTIEHPANIFVRMLGAFRPRPSAVAVRAADNGL